MNRPEVHPLVKAIKMRKQMVKRQVDQRFIAKIEERIQKLASETMGRIGSYVDSIESKANEKP